MNFEEGGVKPVKASGTRWIAHKVNAMKVCLDKWGIYIMHLETLSEDRSIPTKDRSKLKGYLKDWSKPKVPLLLAYFIDLLSICSRLSLSFQDNKIDVVSFITALEKAKHSLHKFETRDFEKLPYVKDFLSKLVIKGDLHEYQHVELKNFQEVKEYVKNKKTFFLEKVRECISSRIEDEDDSSEMFVHIPKILNCEGWDRNCDESSDSDFDFADDSIEILVNWFKVPLENAGTNFSIPHLISQWHILLEYANRFLKLSGVSYLVTWRKLFSSPSKKDWVDILNLIQLLFTIPVSNAKLERMFSKMKRLKTVCRASLGTHQLEHLLRIVEDGPSFTSYNVMPAVEFWANQKYRRPNQNPRRKYKQRPLKKRIDTSLSDSSSESECEDNTEVDIFSGGDVFFESK